MPKLDEISCLGLLLLDTLNTPRLTVSKSYEMSGVKVSVADIIAYQIGWGELLIYWYTSGTQEIDFVMPSDGFKKWD